MCLKRTYPNESAAKAAHRKAGWRLRIYWCRECSGYHVTNHEKGY